MSRVRVPELPEALPRDCTYRDVAWQMDLEHVPGVSIDPRKLFLHSARLAFAARMVGLGGLRIRESSEGQQFQDLDVVGITGVSAHGSATGVGASQADEPETSSYMLEDSPKDHEYFDHYSWPILNIDINKAEVANRVAERRDNGTAPEALWADELDESIKQSLIGAGREQLLEHGDFCKTMTAVQLVSIVGGAVEAFIDPVVTSVALFGSLSLIVGSTVFEAIVNVPLLERQGVSIFNTPLIDCLKMTVQDKRWSLFPTYQQPDRFLLAKAVLSTGSVISYNEDF